MRASSASLAYAPPLYRRSRKGCAHRIAAAPSMVGASPWSLDRPTRGSQPWRQTPRARTGVPGRSHERSTPSKHVRPAALQTPSGAASLATKGRTTGASGRQSWVRATSGGAMTSLPSSTHPEVQRAATSHGHVQARPSEPVHCVDRCAARETSTLPATQRARPSEQSVPSNANVPWLDPPTPRSRSQIERQPFSQPVRNRNAATSSQRTPASVAARSERRTRVVAALKCAAGASLLAPPAPAGTGNGAPT